MEELDERVRVQMANTDRLLKRVMGDIVRHCRYNRKTVTFELYSFFVIIMGFVAVVTMFLSED